MAKALVARSATLTATASCLPIGTPHCTRALPHLRQSSRPALAIPAVVAGSVSRPVLRVTSATRRPSPSRPIRFSRGTFTSSKLITPLASALSPMKRLRCSTLTPSQSISTTKALMRLVFGLRAMTTISSASVPFVHQSFWPLRM